METLNRKPGMVHKAPNHFCTYVGMKHAHVIIGHLNHLSFVCKFSHKTPVKNKKKVKDL